MRALAMLAVSAAMVGCPASQAPGGEAGDAGGDARLTDDAALDASGPPGDAAIDGPPQPVCSQPIPTCTTTITFRGAATSVVVRGDFAPDGWTVGVPMTQVGEVWSATLPVRDQQVVVYKLVVDGTWRADPANPRTTPDGFGGVNSVVRVDCDHCPGRPVRDWRDAILYFVMIDRFANGSPANDAPIGVEPAADYRGGDLIGLRQKIEAGYFTALGVTALWLTSPLDNADGRGRGSDGHDYSGYHGYWPRDLESIESRIGTEAELAAVIAVAHAHGLDVILDYAMNHVHAESPLYAAHRDWFWPNDNGRGGDCVCGAGCSWDEPAERKRCWFTSYLPDFDFRNADARRYSVANAIAWAQRLGADGYRLDAVKHIEDAWLTELRARLDGEVEWDQRFYLVGETFTGDRGLIRAYVDPATKLDGQFDFPLRAQVLSTVLRRQGSMADLGGWLVDNDRFYGPGAVMSTFLGNHDVPRVIHLAEDVPRYGDWDDGKAQAWAGQPGLPTSPRPFERLAVAYALLFTSPGVPLLYYGDEFGLPGAGDPDNRRMMPWTGYTADQQALRDRLARLAQVRSTHPALRRGTRTVLGATGDVLTYTTRTATGPGGVTATQAWTENNGTYEVVDVTAGTYRYTFAAPLTGFDAARTQTVMAVASRTQDGAAAFDRATFSIRPDGGAIAERSVVTQANCASCHGTFSAHGGRYTAVDQCEMCHTSQTTDADTGNTVDFGVMLHKIHAGKDLPSVIAGTPYRIIGFGGTVHDFSTVAFPHSIKRCDSCHGGAPQGGNWQTAPSAETCRSCHDNISFVDPPPGGQVLHSGGAQPPGAPCNVCHPANGSIAPIVPAHADVSFDRSHELAITIESVAPVTPGQPITFTFQVRYDGVARNIQTAPLASLRALIVGPNTDYTRYWTVGTSTNPWAQVTVQGSGATGTLTAVDAAAGRFSYTFPATVVIPADATGSFTVAIESAVNAADPRYPTVSPSFAFSVDGSPVVARRQIIDPAKCNACHDDLRFHGGNRRGAAYCVTCHNPENANADRIARAEGSQVLAESVDFRVMIHKIHMGEELSQPYILGANPTPTVANPQGTQVNFAEVRYPRSRAECSACHLPGTWTLPAAEGRAQSILQEITCTEDPAADADGYCTSPFWNVTQTFRLAPETSVCTSCHDAPYVTAHAQLNTTMFGVEACTTCHGAGKTYDVAVVHAQ